MDKFLESKMEFARAEAAKAWGQPTTSNKVMDPVLAEEFAKILVTHMYAPHLGCATTGEILTELEARSDLDYRTVGD